MLKDELEKKEIKYWFQRRVLSENGAGAWFSAANFNGLFYHDFDNEKINYLGSFPTNIYSNSLYWDTIRVNDDILFLPRYAEDMIVYNIVDKTFLNVNVVPSNIFEKIDFRSNYLGYISVRFDNEVFFIYRCSPFVAYSKCNDYNFKYITCESTGEAVRVLADYAVSKNLFIAPIADSNRFVVLDMEKRELSLKSVGNNEDRFLSICKYDENTFLLLEEKGGVFSWNCDSNLITEVVSISNTVCSTHQPLSLQVIGRGVYLIPLYDWFGNSNTIYKIELTRGAVERFDVFKPYDGYIKFMVYSEFGKYGYFLAPYGEDINCSGNVISLELDIHTRELHEKDIILADNFSWNEVAGFQQKLRRKNALNDALVMGVVYESKNYSLNDYIGGLII